MGCTVVVGKASPEARRLVRVTEECLEIAIRHAQPGGRLGDISAAVQRHAEEAGFSLEPYPHVRAWITRVASQPGFLATMHSYSDDPHSALELP